MQIIEVKDKKTIREFLKVPKIIYKNDPVWVCPLDRETESIFDPKENSFFTHGEAARWILKDIYDKAWVFHENFTPMLNFIVPPLSRSIQKRKPYIKVKNGKVNISQSFEQ